MDKKKTTAPIDYLWLALLAFGGFGLELLLPMVEPDGPVYLHHILTSILWASAVVVLWQVAARRFGYNIFRPTARPGRGPLLAALVVSAATIGSVAYLWGGFKPLLEYQSAASTAGFVWQYIYYLFEALLIFSTIAYGQRFGDAATQKAHIPWGGIVLALTWGLVHILTQNFLTGMAACLWALLYGVVYLLCKKNPAYALPLIVLMFIV